jgi:hypothetical protein
LRRGLKWKPWEGLVNVEKGVQTGEPKPADLASNGIAAQTDSPNGINNRVLLKIGAKVNQGVPFPVAAKQEGVQEGRLEDAYYQLLAFDATLGPLVLGRDPALLWRTRRAVTDSGVAGERVLIVVVYFIGTSRVTENPLSGIVKADSSSGKNYVVNRVVRFLPQGTYLIFEGVSANALHYEASDALKHKLIIVTEDEGASQAKNPIRQLQSERRLRKTVTEKDEKTGKHKAVRYDVEAPAAWITTTTAANKEVDDENRNISLHMDDSEDQTKRVLVEQGKIYGGTISPKLPYHEAFLNFQAKVSLLAGNVRVVVPFAGELAEKFPTKPVRVRRDFPRFLDLIVTSAILHREQRQRDSEGRIVAAAADYYYAKLLSKDYLERSIQQLPPQTQRILEAAKKYYSEGQFTQAEIAQKLKLSPEWVQHWILPLRDNQFEVVEGGKGRQYRYRLLDLQATALNLPEWTDLRTASYGPPDTKLNEAPTGEKRAELDTSYGSHGCVFDPTADDPKCPLCNEDPRRAYEVGPETPPQQEKTPAPNLVYKLEARPSEVAP